MTVGVDVATEAVRTDTSSPFTWSHAGAASGVKGVIVAAVHGVSSTDHVSAVTYGGVALTRQQRNIDTATEPGAAELWFLGSGVPQGTQTVSVTCGATTDDFHFTSITLTGARDTRVIDQDGVNENVANPSVTLQYANYSSMAFAALYGGGAAPSSFAENANCTRVHDHDLGAFYSAVCRQTTVGGADFAIGGTASTDDVAFAAIAVTDAEATGTAATTNAADTSSASGTVTVTGTSAATNAADASGAAGLVTVLGSAATTNAADTTAAVGTVAALGTSAAANVADASSASGTVSGGAITGTSAAVNDPDASSAGGTVSGGAQQPAPSDGPWVKLTGEYPKPRRRKRKPRPPSAIPFPAELPASPAPPAIAPPALRLVESEAAPFRESIEASLVAPATVIVPLDEDAALAIALLLAA